MIEIITTCRGGTGENGSFVQAGHRTEFEFT